MKIIWQHRDALSGRKKGYFWIYLSHFPIIWESQTPPPSYWGNGRISQNLSKLIQNCLCGEDIGWGMWQNSAFCNLGELILLFEGVFALMVWNLLPFLFIHDDYKTESQWLNTNHYHNHCSIRFNALWENICYCSITCIHIHAY